MRIKTITKNYPAGVEAFDIEVNRALAEGWSLLSRKMLHGQYIGHDSFPPTICAELVKTEPQPFNPFQALEQLREFCRGNMCSKGCPLQAWCNRHLVGGEGPADWTLPGEEITE